MFIMQKNDFNTESKKDTGMETHTHLYRHHLSIRSKIISTMNIQLVFTRFVDSSNERKQQQKRKYMHCSYLVRA